MPQLDPALALAQLAAAQRHVFTVPDARACGWTPAAINAARRSGRWHRVTRGAYVAASVWSSLTSREQHLCLAQGRLLLLCEGWLVARRSAAIAYGLPLIGNGPAEAQLVRQPTSARARATSRHERFAALEAADRARVGQLPVTSLARTVLDIARAETFRSSIVVADAALRRGLTQADLADAVDRMSGWPGASRAAATAAFADGRTESPLESLSRVLFHEEQLPRPEPQVELWVDGRFEARVDFLWREQRTIGEADGKGKYAGVQDLYAEKRREERLRDLGFEVVRWDWDAVWRAERELLTAVRRSLARGALNTLAPGVALRSGPVFPQRGEAASGRAA